MAAIVVMVDPFEWNLLRSLSRDGDAVVKSMPVDTALYIGLNMEQLTPAALARVIDPFLVKDIDLDYREFAELLNDLDAELESSVGFNLTDDILPWIGPSVGIGFVDYQFSQYGSLDELQALVVAESKDNQAADNFINKFLAGVTENTGSSFREEEYEGVTIYDAEWEEGGVAVAHSGDLVYFGANQGAVMDGIDAQSGDSLADNEAYSQLEREMTPERAVTLYLSAKFIEDSTGGFSSDIPIDPQDLPFIGLSGGAVTLSFIDQGLRLDLLSVVDKDRLSEEEKLVLVGSEAKTADMFPEDTVIYFTGGSLSGYWDALLAVTPDYEEAMAELQDEIGFDIVNDLIVYLDGETGIGLWPSTSGVLANAANIPLAFSVLAGTSDEEAVSSANNGISSTLEDNFIQVESKTKGYFFIASSEEAVADVFQSDSSLAESDRYKEVWSAFPGGTSPVLFIDADGLAEAIRDSADMMGGDAADAASLLGPITYLALGSDFEGDVTRLTSIIFLENQ
jgi:hypothetical protein